MRRKKPLSYLSLLTLLLSVIGVIAITAVLLSSISNRVITQETSDDSRHKLEIAVANTTGNSISLQKSVARQAAQLQPLEIPKLSDGSSSNLKMHNPRFSPSGDRYLSNMLVNGQPSGLWLVSLTQGVQKQFVKEQSVAYNWVYDDNHIVYAPWPIEPRNQFTPPSSQPLSLINLEKGEVQEIGKTTDGWNVESAPTGDIAYINGDTIHVLNLLTRKERLVSSILTIGHPLASAPEIKPNQEPEKLPDIFVKPQSGQLIPDPLEPDPLTRTAMITGPLLPNVEPVGCFPPACEIRFRLSPDGKKLALQQILAFTDSALVIVDIDSQKSTFITGSIAESWFPFSWSPDSMQLAYSITPEKTRMPELWVVNADGSNPRQVSIEKTHRGFYDFVTWMPNQQDIIYIFRQLGGTFTNTFAEGQVVNINGGEPFTLFVGGETIQRTNDGQRLFFRKFQMVEERPELSMWIASLSY